MCKRTLMPLSSPSQSLKPSLLLTNLLVWSHTHTCACVYIYIYERECVCVGGGGWLNFWSKKFCQKQITQMKNRMDKSIWLNQIIGFDSNLYLSIQQLRQFYCLVAKSWITIQEHQNSCAQFRITLSRSLHIFWPTHLS